MSDATLLSPAMRALIEFRRELSERPVEGIDLAEVEREVLEHLKALGRETLKAVFERADTSAPEVTINGAPYGNRRSGRDTYFSTFGDFDVERST